MVACRHLGLNYAAAAMETSIFGGAGVNKVISGISCVGNEETLLECSHDQIGDVSVIHHYLIKCTVYLQTKVFYAVV